MNKVTHRKQKRDAEQTRENILEIALEEFSSNGFSGARVDHIAKRTRTTKGMIYYYFKDKEGLYKSVLENIYLSIRQSEENLPVNGQCPLEDMEKIIDFTFDYHADHQNFVRLVMIENIHHANILRNTTIQKDISQRIISQIENILHRGFEKGVFKKRIPAMDLHLLMTSFSFYRISNQHTVSVVLGENLLGPEQRERHRLMIKNTIFSYLSDSRDHCTRSSADPREGRAELH